MQSKSSNLTAQKHCVRTPDIFCACRQLRLRQVQDAVDEAAEEAARDTAEMVRCDDRGRGAGARPSAIVASYANEAAHDDLGAAAQAAMSAAADAMGFTLGDGAVRELGP